MKNVKHRLLLPMQAKGNVGKSLEIATRACWLSECGIDWQGFDLDADNRTLSRLFPDQVQLVPDDGPGRRPGRTGFHFEKGDGQAGQRSGRPRPSGRRFEKRPRKPPAFSVWPSSSTSASP